MKNIFNLKKTLAAKICTAAFAALTLSLFVVSAPDPSFLNSMIKMEIAKIERSNEQSAARTASNIAYAQEDDYYGGDLTPICCENTTPTSQEYCDNSLCTTTTTKICCYGGQIYPQQGEECDDSVCDSGPAVCCDSFANNSSTPAQGTQCDNSLCQYDYVPYCCDPQSSNYTAPEDMDPIYGYCESSSCIQSITYCCDGNWDNYTPPSGRFNPHTCEYGEPTCWCSDNTTSQCGGGEELCSITTGFSTTQGGVSIGGVAYAVKSTPCTPEDEGVLSGLAAADAGPDTPLNTPISLGALAGYMVTSKDYCQNIDGDQESPSGYNRNSSGFCCESPNIVDPETGNTCINVPPPAACGNATNFPTDSGPTGELCSSGDASNVNQNATSYDWTCSNSEGTAYCSVTRTCNGGTCIGCTDMDCGMDDVCKNKQGLQTYSDLGSLNLSTYGMGECWNSTAGACGNLIYIPYTTANLNSTSDNLCNSGEGAYLSSGPTLNSAVNPPMWSWTCATTMGGTIAPPTCQVAKCVESQCQTNPANGLINSFRARPAIVAVASDTCKLTWETDVDSSITDPAQGCRLNGQAVSDNNTNGISVHPGSYNLTCFIGEQFQTQSVRCSVTPEYQER